MLNVIKQRFFAMRNGVVADMLRNAGMPYKVIFGLQVPQLAEIARDCGQSLETAEALWADRESREARLLACYLFPPEEVTPEKAEALARDARTPEEADMLSFRLFKRLPYAAELLRVIESDQAMPPYMAVSLARHVAP